MILLARSICIFIGLYAVCSSAGVDIFEKSAHSEVWNKTTAPYKFNLSFVPIGAKPGKRLVYKGVVTFDKPIISVEASSETTRSTAEGNKLNIEALVFEDKLKVKFSDNTEKEIKLVTTENQFRLFNDQCKKFLIKTRIEPTIKAAKIPPFSMAVSCDKYEDKIILVLSLPAEVEGGESSLVEGGGKGESWKFYELPSTAREDGIIGGIKFIVKSTELNLSLQNIRLKKNEEQPKKDLTSNDKNFFHEMSFGVGTKNLSFDAGSVASASNGIGLDADLLTKPVWSKIQLALSYSTAIVSAKDENNITFSDFSGIVGYALPMSKSRLMPFGFAKLVDFLHKSTQTRLQATLAGLGFDYRFNFNKNQISFNFEYGAFAAKGISSQIRYQLGYQYLILEKHKIALGVFYDTQNFKAVNSVNETRTFKEGNMLIKAILNSN